MQENDPGNNFGVVEDRFIFLYYLWKEDIAQTQKFHIRSMFVNKETKMLSHRLYWRKGILVKILEEVVNAGGT